MGLNTEKNEQGKTKAENKPRVSSLLQVLTPDVKMNPEELPEDLRIRYLPLEGVTNARQLGGYEMKDGRKIKMNRLLRTANLSTATDKDVEILAKDYHLRRIFDFRSGRERISQPDREVEGAENIWLNVLGEKTLENSNRANSQAKATDSVKPAGAGSSQTQTVGSSKATDGGKIQAKAQFGMLENMDPRKLLVSFSSSPERQKYMSSMYMRFVQSEDGKRAYGGMMREILALDGETVLLHCTQGKDRCGMGSALILAVLGADDQLILDDFEISNIYYGQPIEEILQLAASMQADEATMNTVKAMMGVCPQYMKQAMDYMNKEFGSVCGYIESELGITKTDIEKLRNLYLE